MNAQSCTPSAVDILQFTLNLEYLESIRQDERSHVTLIRGAFSAAGITPVAKPPIKLDALGIGFANEAEFLTLARVFEDIGLSAYGYAAGVSTLAGSPYIGTAARILAGAEHAGNLRLQGHVLLLRVPNWTASLL